MLRFFSKMRYQLAAKNHAAKYLRYAIGEIVLVVIGILIASQVNNWQLDSNSKYFKQYRSDLVVFVNMSEREKQHFKNILKAMEPTYNQLKRLSKNHD